MAHGYPDWGRTAGLTTTYQLTDLAELAARLGSIVTFDRRGDVIALDNFEGGLNKVNPQESGTGAGVSLSNLYVRSGNYSALLEAGSDVTGWARIWKMLPYPTLSVVGIEASFARPVALGGVQWAFTLYTGTYQIIFAVYWNDVTDKLEYRDSAGNYVEFADAPPITSSPYLFSTGKLVGDLAGQMYKRFILNDRTYDLSAYAPQVAASGTMPSLRPSVYVDNVSVTNGKIYVDDIIITQNEP